MAPQAARYLGRAVPSRLVCHCLLVEHAKGLLLVDTGLGLRDVAAPRDRLGRGFLHITGPALDPAECAVRQVESLGYRADDVRDIVLTHLDLDHVGGLADFPAARAHVLMAEHEAATLRTHPLEKLRYRPSQFADWSRWSLYAARGERWRGFEAVRALEGLPPEILLVPLVGHTRGHTGVAIDAGARALLHAGDAYFHHDELAGRPAPRALEAFQRLLAMEEQQRRHNRERLVELHRQGTATVFSAHDPEELAALQG